jgi:hypothetical protein
MMLIAQMQGQQGPMDPMMGGPGMPNLAAAFG